MGGKETIHYGQRPAYYAVAAHVAGSDYRLYTFGVTNVSQAEAFDYFARSAQRIVGFMPAYLKAWPVDWSAQMKRPHRPDDSFYVVAFLTQSGRVDHNLFWSGAKSQQEIQAQIVEMANLKYRETCLWGYSRIEP